MPLDILVVRHLPRADGEILHHYSEEIRSQKLPVVLIVQNVSTGSIRFRTINIFGPMAAAVAGIRLQAESARRRITLHWILAVRSLQCSSVVISAIGIPRIISFAR